MFRMKSSISTTSAPSLVAWDWNKPISLAGFEWTLGSHGGIDQAVLKPRAPKSSQKILLGFVRLSCFLFFWLEFQFVARDKTPTIDISYLSIQIQKLRFPSWWFALNRRTWFLPHQLWMIRLAVFERMEWGRCRIWGYQASWWPECQGGYVDPGHLCCTHFTWYNRVAM